VATALGWTTLGVVIAGFFATAATIHADIGRLCTKIDGLCAAGKMAELGTKIDGLGSELRGEMAGLRGEMVAQFARIDARLDAQTARIDHLSERVEEHLRSHA
jgi:hypothetical protein